MSASQDNTDELDKTLLGQLIAEIAKFGGSDKSKASQLAKILLPYIDAYANLARTEAAREAERTGEIYQLKMLQHWQNLHGISIEKADLQHFLTSLEQYPDQPLARVALTDLQSPKKGIAE